MNLKNEIVDFTCTDFTCTACLAKGYISNKNRVVTSSPPGFSGNVGVPVIVKNQTDQVHIDNMQFIVSPVHRTIARQSKIQPL